MPIGSCSFTTRTSGFPPGRAASPAKFQHYREQTTVVQDVSAFRSGVVNYTGGTVPEQLRQGQLSADFFRLFGAMPILGRTFMAEDDRVGAGNVAVLSSQLWKRRFDSNPQVIGRTISLGGEPHTIIGVLGDFDFDDFATTPEVWRPFQLDPNTNDQGHYFRAAGRLKPGVTIEQAKARLELSAEDYRKKFPNFGKDAGFTVQPVREALVTSNRRCTC
jgi:hypothetical protein